MSLDPTRADPPAALHPESLLHVPLIAAAVRDPNLRLVERAVDPTWANIGALPVSLTGFNPFEGAVYLGWRSSLARWLEQPWRSARDFNEQDLLVKDALFLAHDHLHAWSWQLIGQVRPALRPRSGPVPAEQAEDLARAHLLTEAVAVVGLDYWSLCVRDVNSFCDIGSAICALTVSYRERHAPEFRRFCPSLEVQSPGFFDLLAAFYLTGEFPGFDQDDLRRSPLLLRWLEHELSYGVNQRRYARQWMGFLSGRGAGQDREALDAPFTLGDDDRALIAELGRRLWAAVKEGAPIALAPIEAAPASPREGAPDGRWVNVNRLDPSELDALDAEPESRRYAIYQLISAVPYAELAPEDRRALLQAAARQDLAEVRARCATLPRLPVRDGEPRDLFMLN